MIIRSFDSQTLSERIVENSHLDVGFNVEQWLNNQDNIFIKNGDDCALFEKVAEGIYEGHYLFSSATRGQKALDLATDILEDFFITYSPNYIRGLVPKGDRKTSWLTRKVGFVYFGDISTPYGDCELFLLSNPLKRNN